MDAIEPNWISLLWFAAFATICSVAFLVMAGMFPLRTRPDSVKSNSAMLLIVGNVILLAALLLGTGLYGYAELRWTTLIVVVGLIVLFTPGLFETFPSSLRDGRTGLIVLVGVQALALATLAKVAGPSLANIS
jgi:predicted permease